MKVLHVWYSTTIPSVAAPTFQIFKMCQAFSNIGHNTSLLCFVNLASYTETEQAIFEFYGIRNPFNLCRIPVLRVYQLLKKIRCGNFFIGTITALYARINKIDLVYTRQSVIALYALRWGLKVIYETHPFAYGEEKKWDAKDCESQLIKKSKESGFLGLVTLSPLVADAFAKLGVSRSKLIIQPSGVDIERFEERLSKDKARQVLKLPKDIKIVLYSGRFSKLKGTQLIFEIAKRMPTIHFLLIGHWGEKELENEFNQCYANRNIEIRPTVSSTELPLWLASADVLILPTLSSEHSSLWTSPLKLFEYMASGRPIVASNLPNVASILTQHDSGVLIDNDSIDCYINAIDEIIIDPRVSKELGARARKLSLNHTWENRVAKILTAAGKALPE